MDQAALQTAIHTGDWPQAEAILGPVAQSPAAPASLVYNYGKVLIELGRSREAVEALSRVVSADPTHANAWFELGRAALLHEDFLSALNGFERAVALDPADADARRNLGRVALRIGEWALARAAWAPFEGHDAEADIALYRIACETRDESAEARRADLMTRYPDRAAVISALVRVSKGAIPLDLRP